MLWSSLLAALLGTHAFGPPRRRPLVTRRLIVTRRAEGEKTRLDAIDELLPRRPRTDPHLASELSLEARSAPGFSWHTGWKKENEKKKARRA